MTSKSERIREQVTALRAQLAETEKAEKRRAQERAEKALSAAAKKSGLAAELRAREIVSSELLEREFAAIADRLRRAPKPEDGALDEDGGGEEAQKEGAARWRFGK